jgi:hypothetical protein
VLTHLPKSADEVLTAVVYGGHILFISMFKRRTNMYQTQEQTVLFAQWPGQKWPDQEWPAAKWPVTEWPTAMWPELA